MMISQGLIWLKDKFIIVCHVGQHSSRSCCEETKRDVITLHKNNLALNLQNLSLKTTNYQSMIYQIPKCPVFIPLYISKTNDFQITSLKLLKLAL